MKPLKVNCTICMKEEIPSPEILKEISGMIERYKLKSEQYLHFLNVMSMECLNSNEHSFDFDEEFLTSINEIIEKHKSNTSEIGELKNVNEGIKKEADELIIKIKELQAKYDFNVERMSNLNKSVEDYKVELESATGLGKIEIWNI